MYTTFQYRTLASDITRVRKLRKLTQTQLAEACGWSQPVISRLENPNEKSSVTVASLNKLAAALGANLRVTFEPAEAGTLTPPKKPEPSPTQLKELTIFEIDRLNRFDDYYTRLEIEEMRAAGKRVPNPAVVEALKADGIRWEPEEEPEDKWAGRYTVTTHTDPNTGASYDEIKFDTDDEEMMQAYMNGEFG